jgi:hypothetical protein
MTTRWYFNTKLISNKTKVILILINLRAIVDNIHHFSQIIRNLYSIQILIMEKAYANILTMIL